MSTPEQDLAAALGSLPSTQMEKLAAACNDMSIEELGDVLLKEKVAYIGDVDSGWLDQFSGTPFFDRACELQTTHLQHEIEDNQKRQQDDAKRDRRNKAEDSFRRQGDQIRTAKKGLELELALHRHMSGGALPAKKPTDSENDSPVGEVKRASFEKLSAADKVELAEVWGRELAHTHVDAFVKEAGRLLEPHHENEAKGQEAGRTHGARLGLGAGAVLGGMAGFKHPGLSSVGGVRGHALRIANGAIGAGVGAAALGHLGRAVGGSVGKTIGVAKGAPKEKTSSVAEYLEKVALGMPSLRGVAGGAIKAVHGASMGKSVGVGAGVGAVGGAIGGALKKPEPGGSRLGGAMRGAMGGAAAGAVGGAAVKSGVKAFGKDALHAMRGQRPPPRMLPQNSGGQTQVMYGQ